MKAHTLFKKFSNHLNPLAIALLLLAGESRLAAQTHLFDAEIKLIAQDARIDRFFGLPVVLDDKTAAIGSLDFGHGSVYIYSLVGTNWLPSQKIFDPITNVFESFGNALDLEGDVLVVGQSAPFDYLNISGQVYVFRRFGTNFFLEQTLFETNPPTNQLFGASVSLSGKTIGVGNPQDSSVVLAAGSASIYTQQGSNWTLQAKLRAPDPSSNAHFGVIISLDADTAIVGAPQAGNIVGAAYIYVRSGTNWTLQQELSPAGLQIGAQFGVGVLVKGDLAFVGAPGQTVSNVYSGTVFIYQRTGTTWNLVQQLSPTLNTNEQSLRFGGSLAVSDGVLVVGAPGETISGQVISGAAYVYQFTGSNWVFLQKLFASDASTSASFGLSVDISKNHIIAGAHLESQAAPDAGAAYIYTRPEPARILSIRASPSILFPANHKLVPVTISVHSEGEFARCRIVSVSSNEPNEQRGHHEPDWIITGDLTVLLRAERSGQAKLGRIYTITIECTDALGNITRGRALVLVPHDSRKLSVSFGTPIHR